MKYLAIRNWQEFQHYRDRDPVWIKVYGRLLDDADFLALPEAAQAQLVKLWLLASRCRNQMRDDARFLKHALHTRKLYIDELVAAGFVERVASEALAECEQPASPHVRPRARGEAETETETEGEKAPPPPARETGAALPPSAITQFLEAVPIGQRPAWRQTIANWPEGMGYPGGRAADPEDVDVGLLDYLAAVPVEQRDFAPRHVVSFVESARQRRSLRGTATSPRRGGRDGPESIAEQALRVATTFETIAGGQVA